MSATTLTELRQLMDDLKSTTSTNDKKRMLRNRASVNAIKILAGEEWDDAGIGPATAETAATNLYGDGVLDAATLSEGLTGGLGGDEDDLLELCEELDELAELSGNEQADFLEDMLDRYAEPSVITFALLQDESVGIGTSGMKAAFVPDMSRDERKRVEGLNPDTTQFIIKAKNNNLRTEPELFQPFKPMLAKPESAGEPNNSIAQVKVDGYRLLLHVRSNDSNSQIRAYSRRMNDVTASLPELQEIDWPFGDFIFDCEVIAETGNYSDTSSRIGTNPENIDRSTDMEFAMFDLLYANGTDLSMWEYERRYTQLEHVSQVLISDPRVYILEASSNIDSVKQHAVENDYEGVILKNLHAEYTFGKRSKHWVKKKHERSHVDVRVVDLVEGEGRATGTLGKFIVESKEGVPLGGVGTGFTDAEAKRVWENQGEWIGGTIEVSAEAYDEGLRFPVFERDRRDDGEPDSIDKVEELLDVA